MEQDIVNGMSETGIQPGCDIPACRLMNLTAPLMNRSSACIAKMN